MSAEEKWVSPLSIVRKQVASLWQGNFIHEEIIKLQTGHRCPLRDGERHGTVKEVIQNQGQKGETECATLVKKNISESFS